MTDNDIIRGIRENSESAWRELFARTHEQLRPQISTILQRPSETTYEDIFEQACLTLMDNVKDGKLEEGENTNLAGYMYTICRRLATRMENSRKVEEKRRAKILDGNDGVDDSPMVIRIWPPEGDDDAEEEALRFLDRVLGKMSEECRKIFRRFYWDKMPMKDIAAAMGLKNDDVAKATKSKCMKKFKDIAKAMLADDEKAEDAVTRVVERDALRDLLEECRKEAAGDWSIAALTEKDKKK